MAKYTQRKIAAKLAAQAAAGDEEISPEQQGELTELGEGIGSLGRRSTKQALELGGYLARAKAILPERQLGAWVKAICEFSPKFRTQLHCHPREPVRIRGPDRGSGNAPTTLFVRAYADQQYVEHVRLEVPANHRTSSQFTLPRF